MLYNLLFILSGVILFLFTSILILNLTGHKKRKYTIWNMSPGKSRKLNHLKKELLSEERELGIHKKNIQIALKARNLSQRIMNQINIHWEGSKVRQEDRIIVMEIRRDLLALKADIRMLAETHTYQEVSLNLLPQLISSILDCIDGFLNDEKDPDCGFSKEELLMSIRKTYDEIVAEHKRLVAQYKNLFSNLSA